MIKQPAVYVLASGRNGTLYIGVTSDLVKRIWEHKNNLLKVLQDVIMFIILFGMNCMII